MQCMVERFFQNAEIYPDKQAVRCDDTEITYRDLMDDVCRYASFFESNGIKYGDIICVAIQNRLETAALLLAAAAVGVGLAFINPTMPVDALHTGFTLAHSKHIIGEKSFLLQMMKKEIPFPKGAVITVNGSIDGVQSLDFASEIQVQRPDVSRITGKETLILTTTSGSIGMPKTIELTQENKLKRIDAHVQLYGITESDRILASTPIYHSLAERLVLLPLMIGATAVILSKFSANRWLKCVSDEKITFTIAAADQLSKISHMLSSPFIPDISCLRCLVSSSSLLEPHVKRQLLEKLQHDVHEIYGTSECSSVTSINFRNEPEKKESVGKPIPAAEIKILCSDGSFAEPGEIGEVIVRSDLLFKGYFNKNEISVDEFCCEGYFKTSDLGYIDEDGYLYFRGHKKEIIITGGVNIYPYDIEQQIQKIDAIKECAAFAYPDNYYGEVIALAVVLHSGLEITAEDIEKHCSEVLADIEQPSYIFIMDDMPKNEMGKLVKPKLFEAVQSRVCTRYLCKKE